MDGSVSAIYRARRSTRLSRPLFEARLPAGFPSPAEDYIEERIDLNRDLILHPLYTYYARIAGDIVIARKKNVGSLKSKTFKLSKFCTVLGWKRRVMPGGSPLYY